MFAKGCYAQRGGSSFTAVETSNSISTKLSAKTEKVSEMRVKIIDKIVNAFFELKNLKKIFLSKL